MTASSLSRPAPCRPVTPSSNSLVPSHLSEPKSVPSLPFWTPPTAPSEAFPNLPKQGQLWGLGGFWEPPLCPGTECPGQPHQPCSQLGSLDVLGTVNGVFNKRWLVRTQHVQGSWLGIRGPATRVLISSRGPPLQPDSLSLSPFPPLCPSPGRPCPSRVVSPASYRETSIAVSCGSSRAGPQLTLCLIPSFPPAQHSPTLGDMLVFIQPTDHTHT